LCDAVLLGSLNHTKDPCEDSKELEVPFVKEEYAVMGAGELHGFLDEVVQAQQAHYITVSDDSLVEVREHLIEMLGVVL
jgi:hypothetical protein